MLSLCQPLCLNSHSASSTNFLPFCKTLECHLQKAFWEPLDEARKPHRMPERLRRVRRWTKRQWFSWKSVLRAIKSQDPLPYCKQTGGNYAGAPWRKSLPLHCHECSWLTASPCNAFRIPLAWPWMSTSRSLAISALWGILQQVILLWSSLLG